MIYICVCLYLYVFPESEGEKKRPDKVLKCVISEGGTEVAPGVIMERETVYRR